MALNVRLKFSSIKPARVIRERSTNKCVSRLCLAKVHFDEGKWCAIVDITLPDCETEYMQFEITDKSLVNPKYIFSKQKDETGHYETIIRDNTWKHHGYDTEKYDVLREGLIIAGHINKIEGQLYFIYEEFIGYDYSRFMNDIIIKTDTPVFKSGYGNNNRKISISKKE